MQSAEVTRKQALDQGGRHNQTMMSVTCHSLMTAKVYAQRRKGVAHRPVNHAHTEAITVYAAPIGSRHPFYRVQQRWVDSSQRVVCVGRQHEDSTRLVVPWILLEHLQIYHEYVGALRELAMHEQITTLFPEFNLPSCRPEITLRNNTFSYLHTDIRACAADGNCCEQA